MTAADDIHKYFFIVFQSNLALLFQVNPLLGTILRDDKFYKAVDTSLNFRCHFHNGGNLIEIVMTFWQVNAFCKGPTSEGKTV